MWLRSMVESNTVVSAYTMYSYSQQYCVFFFDMVKNIVGKEKKKAGYKHFFPFSTVFFKSVNPLFDMPILGFTNSAANKYMMSKICTNGDTIM